MQKSSVLEKLKQQSQNLKEGSKRLKEKSKELEREIRSKTIGYILAGLGVVVGLAWNDAIKTTIDKYFPSDKGTIIAQFTYAFFITVGVVIIGIYLSKLTKKKK